jgi:hypothetical protein
LPCQIALKILSFLAMCQWSLLGLTGLAVHKCYLLKARMIITSYYMKQDQSAADSQTISVEINPQSDIPLEITNAAATSTPSGMQGLRYTLVNRGERRLLAVEITWKLHLANGGTPTVADRADYAFSTDIAAGASDNMEEGSYVGTRNTSRVQSVTGEITFAQFADGAVFGSDRAKVLPWLKEGRSATLNECHRLLEIYRSGGESALASALVVQSDSDTLRARADRRELRKLQLRNGINAVEAKLSQIASMKLPE